MRKTIGSALLAASLFTSTALAQPNPENSIQALQSPKAEVRKKALEGVSSIAFSLEDANLRERFINILLAQLETSQDPDERFNLANALQYFLSHELTPTRSFLKAEPFLTESDDNVRHAIWLAFYQQASQESLSQEIDDRLLAMVDHPQKKVKMEALNWAIEATQNRQRRVGSPQSALGAESLNVFKGLTQTEDPDLRNLAVYGILAQYEHDPVGAKETIVAHLDDSHGDTRSLILDFLTRRVKFDNRLRALKPNLLARFQGEDLGSGFPLIPDADLGPAAGSQRPEKYRLAVVLALLGPLHQDVWDYLETDALKQVHPGYIVQLAALQGPQAQPLMSKILASTPIEKWSEWTSQIARVGLPEDQVPKVLAKLSQPVAEDASFRSAYMATNLMASLALSPSRSIEVMTLLKDKLESPHPGLRAAAAYSLSRKDPEGPGGQAAVQTISTSDWNGLSTEDDLLLLAAYRLLGQGLKATPSLKIDTPDSQMLLSWILGTPSPEDAKPHFLEIFKNKKAEAQGYPGTGDDLLLLQLAWLAENPRPETKPGLEYLLQHPSDEVRAAAQKALGKLT